MWILAGCAALSLFSCQKDQTTPTGQSNLSANTDNVNARAAGSDAMDAILKDLPQEAYLLSFDPLPQNPYVTRNSYGSLSDETLYPADKFASPDLLKLGYKFIPIKKIWIRTCPTMIPLYDIANRAASLLQKADSKTFADITTLTVNDKQNILATKSFLQAASRLQPDAIDAKVTANAPLEKFRIALPDGSKLPYFTRGFYGIGDIDQATPAARLADARLVLTWKDLIRRKFPNMIGCFDIKYLKDIRANLISLDKRYAVLGIESVPGGAILGSQQQIVF